MVTVVPVGEVIETYAYFYVDDATKHGFLIDPGAEADKLLGIIAKRGFTIEKILLTHGHFDHIGAVQKVREKLNIPVIMHENGRKYAENTAWNLSANFGLDITLDDVTYLPDGSVITPAANPAMSLAMQSVPGHTTDGVIYVSADKKIAFVGDTIFKNSYGNTSFIGGDEKTLMKSIAERIFSLPDDTTLLSGHSDPTTVGEERLRPWYRDYL